MGILYTLNAIQNTKNLLPEFVSSVFPTLFNKLFGSSCFACSTALLWISLYPNPTSDVLNIDKGSNASLEITITNSAGAIVHQSNTQNQITTINMAQMATGMYVVTLKNELGLKVERVVKR